jgi:hypothetical protein
MSVVVISGFESKDQQRLQHLIPLLALDLFLTQTEMQRKVRKRSY